MRIYTPYSNVTVIFLDDIACKADIYWDDDLVRIKQPGYLGGRMERPLTEYDNFEGNFREWILSLRENRNAV